MSQLKAASTAARPLRPIQRQRLWSASSVPTPQPTESVLSSTCNPLMPCQTNSAGPPRFVLTTGLVFYVGGQVLAVALAVGAVAFALVFFLARRAFQRASGGLSFRVGGMRG